MSQQNARDFVTCILAQVAGLGSVRRKTRPNLRLDYVVFEDSM